MFLKDIKASHVAIEAPFQVLLKLSMISIGILNMPGKLFYVPLISRDIKDKI